MDLVSLAGCPRCGRNHEDLEANDLTNPPHRFKRYATCPVTGQPVLLDGAGAT